MESISRVKQALLWLGGYSPRALQHEPHDDREAIAKIGGSVLFAALFATISWGLAGWMYGEGMDRRVQVGVAALAAAIGASVVALLDRCYIFFSDTFLDGGRIKVAIYGLVRAGMVCIISGFTSQTLMPFLFSDELRVQALHMAENLERARLGDLGLRYKVAEKEAAQKSATKAVETLRRAVANLPSDIQSKITMAEQCWVDYRSERSTLPDRENSFEARQRLSAKASQCSERASQANAERDSYLARTRAQLAQALRDEQVREKDHRGAVDLIESRVHRAALIETQGLNPRNSTVLQQLLNNNPTVKWKWLSLTALISLFELLPLLLKFQAGQSNIGRRIATDRALRRLELSTRLQQRQHDFAISSTVSEASVEAVREALANGEVRAIFSQAFAANIAAFAPIEAVRSMMRDLEARHVDVSEFMSRFPQLASVIAEAWSRAVRSTSEILARGLSTN